MRYMDAMKMLKKLRGEADRFRTSLYLSKSIMEEFKEACEGISPSRVIEDLMSDFIESYKAQKKIKEDLTEKK